MCCGAYVIYNLVELSTPEQRSAFISLVQGPPDNLHGRYQLQIILNDSQAKGSPILLQTMAELGFVFVARSNNIGHDSWCNLFVRCHMTSYDEKREYVDPPFTYPGMSVQGWEKNAQPELRKPLPKKVAVKTEIVDPFKVSVSSKDIVLYE